VKIGLAPLSIRSSSFIVTGPFAVMLLNQAFLGVACPITVSSMLPPLMSTVGAVTVPVNVGEAIGALALSCV
jgi:hypothetical protein